MSVAKMGGVLPVPNPTEKVRAVTVRIDRLPGQQRIAGTPTAPSSGVSAWGMEGARFSTLRVAVRVMVTPGRQTVERGW